MRKGQYGIFDLLRPFALILVPVALVMKQPDLGTALVTFAIAMTMVMFAKVKWRDLVILLACGAGALGLRLEPVPQGVPEAARAHVPEPGGLREGGGLSRDPERDRGGQRPVGREGLGRRDAEPAGVLPEQHTDFIFSVWAEEHGFLGAVVLIALYAFLVLAALDVAANARDKFGSFVSLGVAALFFWHAFINMGMVTGLLPVVGVPLPLFSYGGSSVVADMLGIGILLNVSLRRFMF